MSYMNIISASIAILLGAWGLIEWWAEFGLVLRGFFPFALIVFGLLLIASKLQEQENSK